MLFRILKFRPGPAGSGAAQQRAEEAAAEAPRPAVTQRQRVLVRGRERSTASLIQRCARVRDAPAPAAAGVPRRAARTSGTRSRRAGAAPSTASSSTTTRRCRRSTTRSPIGLIELEEGTRLVANIVGIEPGDDHDRHGRSRSSWSGPRCRPLAPRLPAGGQADDGLLLHRGAGSRPRPRGADLRRARHRRAGQGGRAERRAHRPRALARARRRRAARHRRPRGARRAAASGSSSCASCSSSRAARSRPSRYWATLVCGALPIAELRHRRATARPGSRASSQGDALLTAALAESGVNDPFRPRVTRHARRRRVAARRPQAVACPPAISPTRCSCRLRPTTGRRCSSSTPTVAGVERDRRTTSPTARRSRTSSSTACTGRAARRGWQRRLSARWRGRSIVRCSGCAAMQVGVAEGAVRMAAEYTSQRHQFGQAPVDVPGRVARRRPTRYIDTEAMRVTLLAGRVAARRGARRHLRGDGGEVVGVRGGAAARCTSPSTSTAAWAPTSTTPCTATSCGASRSRTPSAAPSAQLARLGTTPGGGDCMSDDDLAPVRRRERGRRAPAARHPADPHADRRRPRSRPATTRTCTTTRAWPSGAGLARHLHEHPDDERVRRPVHHRLGRAPTPILKSVKIRLGAPNYPGDTMTMTGSVTKKERRRRRGRGARRQRPRRPRHRHGRAGAAAMSERNNLKDAAAVVGIGATEFSKDSGRSELRLAVEACEAAIDDAGLEPGRRRRHGHLHRRHQPRDRDRPQPRHRRAVLLLPHPPRRRRGLRHRSSRPCWPCTRASPTYVVCYRAFNERSGHRFGAGVQDRAPVANAEIAHFSWYAPFGLLTPAQWVAMFATRYMHEYGATSEDFGRIAVADRKHAATNPKAWFYEQPITLEDHQAVAVDRRAAPPARLLPGERRRTGARRHDARAGPRPAEPAA